MKNFTFIFAVSWLLINGVAASAAPGTLYTSVLFTGGQLEDGRARCSVTNVSSSEISATIVLLDDDGEVLRTVTTTIQPQASDHLSHDLDSGDYYCKFVVSNSKSVRANFQLLVFDPALGILVHRAVAEAR